VVRTLQADYLVVGAGAFGMGFTDALIDHSENARVVMVDRRHSVGGHWLEAYPFVRLHQSSCFYGVASTLLGGGALQTCGPEAGLQERASQPEITSYYARILDRLVRTDRVEFFPNSDFDGHRTVTSRISGERFEVPGSCRIVNAHYLAPTIPAEVPPPFAVSDGTRVVAVNDLARLEDAPSQYVIVGSGKTATDAIVASIPARSAGYARATRGCSTGPSCSPTPPSSSAWPPTSCRRRRRRRPSTTRSSGWRRPA